MAPMIAAGVDGPVDQRPHIGRGDVGVTNHLVGAAVIADHDVEHARIRVGVEQEQKFLHRLVSPRPRGL
jgi:hypothetical protein